MADPAVIVRTEPKGSARWIVLDRPEIRNALSAELIRQARETTVPSGSASPVAVIRAKAATTNRVSSSACAASAASAWAPASITRLASSCSSGELKRTTPARV